MKGWYLTLEKDLNLLSRVFLISRGKCCGHKCLMCPYTEKHRGTSLVVREDVLKSLSKLEKSELKRIKRLDE